MEAYPKMNFSPGIPILRSLTRRSSPGRVSPVSQATFDTVEHGESSGATKGKALVGKSNKFLLLSGGGDHLETLQWLRNNYGCEVVSFIPDVGQGVKELDDLVKMAEEMVCPYVETDLKEDFAKNYIFPCLRAGAIYERKDLLGTPLARYVTAKAMVDVAKEVGADAVSIGCTGKGNDQFLYGGAFSALNPELKFVVVPGLNESIYREMNLLHMSHEGYVMTVDPELAPDKPEYVKIGLVSALPVSVNGERLSPASLLSKLNEIGGKHGIGRMDMVENQLVGVKNHRVYEAPGGTIVYTAVRELESLTLDRKTMQVKDSLALKYAELVHAGQWFNPLRESMDAFMEKITTNTTGSVDLKLYKGSVTVVDRRSPHSLYRKDISSLDGGQMYNQADVDGFIRLHGLPMTVRAMLEKRKNN